MRRLIISARFSSQATQPSGEPPEVDVDGRSEWVSVHAADESDAGIQSLSYSSHAKFTGESTFTERGRVIVGDTPRSTSPPSPKASWAPPADPELQSRFGELWRIERGHGRFQGASGLITSRTSSCARPAARSMNGRWPWFSCPEASSRVPR